MKKYKRWILILTALTVFVVVQVDSLRATSLIHAGKFTKLLNTSSTSSTTASPSSSEAPSSDRLRELLDEVDDEEGVIDVNGTKITLTGIPQIDYVWDPNLPRELNGFNLSSYPFLDSMPAEEDIGFDCEDKKNGFYASVKYSCQLYHHCLYGVRSDFICANFTAFDQKTFICHFVSEVDCKNSHKYWSRNDDLYKATTVKTETTSSTLVPLFDRGFYNRTRNAFRNGGGLSSSSSQNSNSNNNSPSSSSQNTSNNNNSEKSPNSNRDAPLSNNSNNNNNRNTNNNNNNNLNNNDDYVGGRPLRPLRRPGYRRRPIDYYYDDDEYLDYYEERIRRRNRPRNRRPYNDYDTRRPDNRRPYYEDDFDDYDYRPAQRNRNRSESRNNSGGRYDDRRGGNGESRRRPIYDDDRRRNGDRRQQDDKTRVAYSEERRFSDDKYDDNRNNFNNRRNNPLDENKRKPAAEIVERKQNTEETVNDEKLVKPVGTSIFDRVRPPPRINRPVPLSERNKFAYKASESPNSNVRDDLYDDEDIAISSSTASTTTTTTAEAGTKSSAAPSTIKPFSFQKLKPLTSSSATLKPKTTTASPPDEITEVEYIYEDEDYDTSTQKSVIETSSIKERASLFTSRLRNENILQSTTAATSTTTSTTIASSPDSFRLNRYKNDNSKENIQQQQQQTYVDPLVRKPLQPSIIPNGNSSNKKFANKQTFFEPVTQGSPVKQQNNFQNAYNNRNLENKHDYEPIAENKEHQQKSLVKVNKRPFLPSRGGEPYKARGLQPVGILADQPQRQSVDEVGNGKHLETHKLTLEDLYNEEYDVDLNDALNPMLKPLTSSRNVQGYSSQTSNADDPQKSQSQKITSRTDHVASASSTEQPEYEYEYELEYPEDAA